MMKPKSMLRIGRIFIAVGISIVISLLYHAGSCPDRSCVILFASLSFIALVISVVVFIIISIFAMRLWLKKDKALKRKAWSKSRRS